MKVLLKNGKKLYDLNERVANVVLSDNIDSFSRELSFDYLFNRNDKMTQDMHPEIGDTILLVEGKNILHEGKMLSYSDGFDGTVHFKILDYGYLLNKNEVTIQFNGISTSAAIKALCKKYEIKHSICNIGGTVRKNYYGETIGAILKDIIGRETFRTGKKYRLEVDGDMLKVLEYKDLLIKPTYQGSKILKKVESLPYLSNLNIEASSEEMYNHIVLVKDEQVIAEVFDKESIKKYGRLSKTVTDDTNIKELLKSVKSPSSKISLILPGDFIIRSGRLIELGGKRFIIVSSSHEISQSNHITNIELKDAKFIDASIEKVDSTKETEVKNSKGRGIGKSDKNAKAMGYYVSPTPNWHGIPGTYPNHTHNARDIPVWTGTPIHACDGGVVTWVQYWDGFTKVGNQSYGNCVKIDHGKGRYTLYAHLSKIGVSVGQKVKQGRVIGHSGNTGNSRGPHLHLEIVHNGKGIDPIKLIRF